MEKEIMSTQETCPHCGIDSIINVTKFEIQNCSGCGVPILPCSICAVRDCDDCPFEEERLM